MPGQSIKLLQIVIRGVAQEQNKISLRNLFKFGILGGASVLSLIVWGNLGGGLIPGEGLRTRYTILRGKTPRKSYIQSRTKLYHVRFEPLHCVYGHS